MSEKTPTQDEGEGKLSRERVIRLLKEDPSDLAPYIAYRDQLIEELPKNAGGSLELSVALADICIEVGFYQAAYDELDAAITQVSTNDEIPREQKDDLLARLYGKIDALPPLS
jgi:hypothetical protein